MSQVTVKIADLSRGGSGVARLESGEVVFVPYTVPGDQALVEITERKKNYIHAKLIELTQPSSQRVTPPCPIFTQCGGCSWQHVPYELQFETKRKGLLHALSRAGVNASEVEVDSVPAKNHYHYRNRIQLRGVVATKSIGFYQRGSQTIVPMDDCAIADTRINAALPALKAEGFKTHTEDFKLEVSLDDSGKLQHSWNQPHSALGFRQVNDDQNLALQAWVATHIAPAETLYDLYGGSGNLSRGLAHKFESIHCVDTHVPRESNIPNLRFHKSSVGRWIEDFATDSESFSVILDPPREGLTHDFLRIADGLESLPIASLILIGCDVDAFVRDVQGFIKRGYRLKRLAAVDLFPQTPHLESLALFMR